jgi:peptide/nickel transport system substrate-binding protein
VRLLAAVVALPLMNASVAEAATFRFAFQGDVATLEPYGIAENFTQSFLNNIYEPLVRYNGDMVLEPALAVSWEQTDPLTWRFDLRHGVTFHDGSPFTAQDVVFSLGRAQSEGADMAMYVGAIAEIRVIDDYTIDLITPAPQPVLDQIIARWLIMDREWAEAHGAEQPTGLGGSQEAYATTHANGTGPFRLVSREPGVKTVLEANPTWWDQPQHNLTEVVFTPIAADATRTAAMLSGELDLMYPVPLQDVDRMNAADGISVLQGPELRTVFLGMNQFRDELPDSDVKGKNPLKDVRVRRAFYQAIDIEAIRSKIMRGAATPAGLLVGPGIRGFTEEQNERLPYDPEAARRLLAEAGYPDGFTLAMDCPNDRYVNDEAICQAVVGMLGRIGVDVNLQAQTKSLYFEKLLDNEVSFYLVGWTSDSMDAGSVIANLMVPPEDGGLKWNAGHYGNPRITELSKTIKPETDMARREEMMDEVWRIMKEDVGYIPLHQQALAWAVRDVVTTPQRLDNALMLWHVQLGG